MFVHISGRYVVSEFVVENRVMAIGGMGWGHHSDEWFIQVLEADALNVASIGRAVAAGAEVWRGGLPGGTEATGGRHQAADGRAGRLHPVSSFYHRGARPAGERTWTREIMSVIRLTFCCRKDIICHISAPLCLVRVLNDHIPIMQVGTYQ